jgi:murein L,D-transpeptidase YafK
MRTTHAGKFQGKHRVLALLTVVALALPWESAHAQHMDKDFLGQQKQFARVRGALQHKAETLDRSLATQGLKRDELNILIVAYKAEAQLELYAKQTNATRYQKLAAWPICRVSGKLGPKRRQGDRQTPEGFYRIDRFNPASNFHLSLGVDYPNAADKLKTRAADPGGEIFIHGSCVTVGCLPMRDAVFEEIYLYAVYARDSGQRAIPVYIFPFRMTQQNMEKYEAAYRDQPELLLFWQNIRTGYDKFFSSGEALRVSVTREGDYRFGP